MLKPKLEGKYLQSQTSKHILILGSGFGGIEVLKKLQKKLKNNNDIDMLNILHLPST